MAEAQVMTIPKRALKALMRLVVRDHWNGWFYAIEAQPSSSMCGDDVECRQIEDVRDITGSPYEELRRQAWKLEPDTFVFGAWFHRELAAVCWFQAGETHRRRGGLFHLGDDEAELAQITTASAFRGRGIACHLIRYAVSQMSRAGYRRLHAKIWHDNAASKRAFERAGWRPESRFLSIHWRYSRRRTLLRLPRFKRVFSKSSAL